MKIEVLYPEICTLFGDKGNMKYLSQCLPEAEFISTDLNDKPLFLQEDIDLVYMCSMSEKSQELILSRLMQYKEEIAAMIKDGKTLFLFVGNSLELLGSYIQREDGSKVDGLGCFEFYSVRQAPNRFNNLMKAKFKDITLIGYSSRFSHTYGIPEDISFCKTDIGKGMNPDTNYEGIFTGRLIATYLLGPLLIQNPDFVHFLLNELGHPVEKIPYEAAMREAYEYKLKEFEKPDLELS
ncbi:MAG: hypothetical protein ACI4EF_00815 [Coprococcus sp.]